MRGTLPRAECVDEECEAFANLLIELEALPRRPLWLRVQGSHPQLSTNAWTFYPKGWSPQQEAPPGIQLSVPLAAGDSCVDIQIYGVEGRSLLHERRCQPERCAVYGIVAARNSGGGPGGSPVDVKAVPPSTCDNPPILLDGQGRIANPAAADSQMKQSGLDASAESYADDASMPMLQDASARTSFPVTKPSPKPPAANSCNVLHTGSSGTLASPLLSKLGLAILLLRRRRARKRPA